MRMLDAEFDDLDRMRACVRAWNLEFQPLSIAASRPRVGRVVQSNVNGALLAHARFRTCLDQAGAPPPGLVTFGIQESRLRGLWWRGRDVDADTVLAFPVGGELRCVSGADFDVHTLSVSEEALGGAAMALELELPRTAARPEVFRAPRSILDPIRLRLRSFRDGLALARPDDIADILMALLPNWLRREGHGLRPRPSPRARQRAIRLSLELMESQDLAALGPAALRAHSSVSERTLEYAFRERFGLTPAAFIKARRLAAARTALSRADPGKTQVSDILADFGFWHFGQFAKDYRQAFGERPSDTLRRNKAPQESASRARGG